MITTMAGSASGRLRSRSTRARPGKSCRASARARASPSDQGQERREARLQQRELQHTQHIGIEGARTVGQPQPEHRQETRGQRRADRGECDPGRKAACRPRSFGQRVQPLVDPGAAVPLDLVRREEQRLLRLHQRVEGGGQWCRGRRRPAASSCWWGSGPGSPGDIMKARNFRASSFSGEASISPATSICR